MRKNEKFAETLDASRRYGELHQTIPSTVDPVQSIEAEGDAYRNLKKGHQPWWIIISSWVFIAFPMALLIIGLYYAVISDALKETPKPVDYSVLPALMLVTLFSALPGSLIYIVVKGTINKLKPTSKKANV